MKENLYNKEIKLKSYSLKNLTVKNALELKILTNECYQYWKEKKINSEPNNDNEAKKIYLLNTEKIVKSLTDNSLNDFLQRAEQFINEVMPDGFLTEIDPMELFMFFPSLQLELNEYKEELKKK